MNPCWKEILDVSSDLIGYLEKKTGVKYDPVSKSGKEEFLNAIKELKQQSVNDLANVHTQLDNPKFKKDAIQESSPSSLLQHTQETTGETGSERERMERSQQGNEPPGKGTEAEGEDAGEAKGIGITHADTEKIRIENKLPEYDKKPETVEQWNIEADKRIKNGELPGLIKKMESGGTITEVEQIMMGKYIATLDAEISKNPSNENIAALKQAIELSDAVGGSAWGRSGRARQETFLPDDSLGGSIIDEMESLGVNELPQKTKEQVIKEHEELTKTKEELAKANEQIEQLQKEAQAKIDFEKDKKTTKKADSKRDFGAEKQSLKDKLKQQIADYKAAGNKLGIVADGGAESFVISAQMAKTIGQYIKVNIEEGVSKFEDLVNKVYDDIKDLGLSKRHIIDVMAGVYKEKVPTRNELAAKLIDFKTEAVLLQKLADARLGKEPKTEKEQTEKSRRIIELENKVKEIRERNKDKTPVEKTEGERLATKRKFIQKSIDEIEADIKQGKFEKPVRLAPVRLDKKTQALNDRLIQLETQQMIRRQKNEYEKSSRFSKAADTFWQILGLRRFVNSAIDFSILFRQASPITMNIAKYLPTKNEQGKIIMGSAPKAIGTMFNVAFNPKGFDRFQYNLEKSEQGRMFTHFNGVFSNPTEVKMDKREEEFTNSILARIHQKIEGSGSEGLKKTANVLNAAWFSERAAAGLLNSIRIQEFTKGAIKLKSKGITPENSPEHYKELVKWVMNSTGRGNMLKTLEDSHAGRLLANRTYFGARLMAAKLNMLNPAYYVKMPKEVRIQALKDMAGYSATFVLAALALKASGATISTDFDEPDFLQVRFGDKVFDISGGSAGYIRTFLRFQNAIAKQIMNPGSKAANSYSKFAGKSMGKTLFANKLSPNSAYIWHVAGALGFPLASKSSTYDESGHLEPFDPYEVVRVYPLYVDGTIKAYKEGGMGEAMTILLPDLFGIGTQQYDKKGGTGGGSGASGGFKQPTSQQFKPIFHQPKPR